MATILFLIKALVASAPFLLTCLLVDSDNLGAAKRYRQAPLPFLALLYCIVLLAFFDDVLGGLMALVSFIASYVPLLASWNFTLLAVLLFNPLAMLGFAAVKGVVLLLVMRGGDKPLPLYRALFGFAYEYDETFEKWVLKRSFIQVRSIYRALYLASIVLATLLFCATMLGASETLDSVFFPVFAVIVLGEVYFFLSGMTLDEYLDDIGYDSDNAQRITNYNRLVALFRALFPEAVLHASSKNQLLQGETGNDEIVKEFQKGEDRDRQLAAAGLERILERSHELYPDYAAAMSRLMGGQSVLFATPFYRDLTDYVFFPLNRELMRGNRAVVIIGPEDDEADVLAWIEEGLAQVTCVPELWCVDLLANEADGHMVHVGLLPFSSLNDARMALAHRSFFARTTFAVMVDPSNLLATSQVGLSLFARMAGEGQSITYCVFDRNTDGLVDSLSHVLRASFTEVSATDLPTGYACSLVWDADSQNLHHRLFGGVSRYLGMGTEIAAVAGKCQVENVDWYGNRAVPLSDIRWLDRQYYSLICEYAERPLSQSSFDDLLAFHQGLWCAPRRDSAFVVAEDEYCNSFEVSRQYLTRARSATFVNVLSPNYLMRDYMRLNAGIFDRDPKAVAAVAPDYARSQKNQLIELLMELSGGPLPKEVVIERLASVGLETDEPVGELTRLIGEYLPQAGDYMDVRDIVCLVDEERVDVATMTINHVERVGLSCDATLFKKCFADLMYAAFVVEDADQDKDGNPNLGSRLYGHVCQVMLPGQYVSKRGKYYEVLAINHEQGVLLRRAADHFSARRSYRQLRTYEVHDWDATALMGRTRQIGGLSIEHARASIVVHTHGYLSMGDYGDFETAHRIDLDSVEDRYYARKDVFRISSPELGAGAAAGVAVLLNELFRTVYPNDYPYVRAVASVDGESALPAGLLDGLEGEDVPRNSIYLIEDSPVDMGLLPSVDRNLERFFEMLQDLLIWHAEMLDPSDEPREVYDTSPQQGLEQLVARKRRRSWWRTLLDAIGSLFGRKKPNESGPGPEGAQGEPKGEELDPQREGGAEGAAGEAGTAGAVDAAGTGQESQDELSATGEVEEAAAYTAASSAAQERHALEERYRAHHYLLFGADGEGPLDLEAVMRFLERVRGTENHLTETRRRIDEADRYALLRLPGDIVCDFCGRVLTGAEYDRLEDGRCRCPQCTKTSLKSADEFGQLFGAVRSNYSALFDVRMQASIKVRMVSAKKIAALEKKVFIPTDDFDARPIGVAVRKMNGDYCIYIENGAPRLSAVATIAHELTHIWQYLHWDEEAIAKRYGDEALVIYEGMAKWVELQYLFLINEGAYALRQLSREVQRQDVYGRGLRLFLNEYPLCKIPPMQGDTPFAHPDCPLTPMEDED